MRILVTDPFTGKSCIVEHDLPCILFFGTEEECCIYLILNEDKKSWYKYRGPLHDYLKKEIFSGRRAVLHVDSITGKQETIQ